jgi:hypothetical protein
VFQDVGGAHRVLYQKEYWTESGGYSADSALLGIPKLANGAALMVHVAMPTAIAGHAATAVAFAETLR